METELGRIATLFQGQETELIITISLSAVVFLTVEMEKPVGENPGARSQASEVFVSAIIFF